MSMSLKSLTLKSQLCGLALSAVALVACGQPEVQEVAPEGLPEPIYTIPTDDHFSAQAVTAAKLATLRAELLAAVNKARSVSRKCGTVTYPAVPALAPNSLLGNASQAHATDMITKNFFSHAGSDGSTPGQRMTRAGYKFSAAGENIAAGNTTTALTMQQWLASEGHCKNIMSTNYTQIGFGYNESPTTTYRYYWVQDFGKP